MTEYKVYEALSDSGDSILYLAKKNVALDLLTQFFSETGIINTNDKIIKNDITTYTNDNITIIYKE